MNYDSILTEVGGFGLYQRRVYFMVCMVCFPHLFSTLGYVFWAARTDHWCHVDKPLQFRNVSDELWKNWTIPVKEAGSEPGRILEFESCTRYSHTDNMTALFESTAGSPGPWENWNLGDSGPYKPCDSWDYDMSQYKSSIVSKYSLVCERQWLTSTTQSVFMASRMGGSVVLGFLSDRFGRRPIILVCVMMDVLTSIVIVFAPNIYSFIALRGISGLFTTGSYQITYIYVLEIVGPSWRVFAGNICSLFWAGSYMLLPLIAYFIRDHVTLMLVLSVPWLLLLAVLYWIIPESPRWLLAKQRNSEAFAILRKIAKVNRCELPDEYNLMLEPQYKEREEQIKITDVLTNVYIWKMTLVLIFIWFTINIVYYGLSLNSTNLGGNDYLNVFIAGAVEVPAYLACYITFVYFGRQWPISGMKLLAGLSLFSILLVPAENHTAIVALVSIGKFAVTSAFGMIYIYTPELYPTSVRCLIFGICGMAAKIGGILAPFAADLMIYYPATPYIICGGLAMIASLLILSLPETKGISLPQTLQEGKLLAQQPNAIARCLRMTKISSRENGNNMQMHEKISDDKLP